MNPGNIGLALSGVLLAIACGDVDSDAPKAACDGSACPSGGSAGVGGTGAASGQGGTGAASGRGGSAGSSAAGGTGASGSGGTTSQDAGGQAGSSMSGSGGMNGSGGSGVRDAAPDVDASRSDASDAASDAERRCFEPTRLQDAGSCTLSICRRGATVEISATHSNGWLVGALFWTLAVCDTSFTRSRSPGGDIRTLIYDVPEADWARMRDGDPVFMYYGTPGTSSAATPCGRLTRNIQNCPP